MRDEELAKIMQELVAKKTGELAIAFEAELHVVTQDISDQKDLMVKNHNDYLESIAEIKTHYDTELINVKSFHEAEMVDLKSKITEVIEKQGLAASNTESAIDNAKSLIENAKSRQKELIDLESESLKSSYESEIKELKGVIADLTEKHNSQLDYINSSVAELGKNQTKVFDQVADLSNKRVDDEIAILEKISSHEARTAKTINSEIDSVDASMVAYKETVNAFVIEQAANQFLEQKVYFQDELLKLNDHINTKLNSLRGEKGTDGEQGPKGDNGFLSGVSLWEDGSIAKKQEAFTHNNGIWLCNCDTTAKTPGIDSDEWILINDGLSDIKIDNNQLVVTMSSGEQQDLGVVSMSVHGAYDESKVYDNLDIVVKNGTSFISNVSNNASEPPGKNWTCLASKGAKGNRGPNGPASELMMDDLYPIVCEIIDSRSNLK